MAIKEYKNQDLIDFKILAFGKGRGTIKPLCRCFGMNQSTWYAITNSPDSILQPWYAAMLRVYQSMDINDLNKYLSKAHSVDLFEVRNLG